MKKIQGKHLPQNQRHAQNSVRYPLPNVKMCNYFRRSPGCPFPTAHCLCHYRPSPCPIQRVFVLGPTGINMGRATTKETCLVAPSLKFQGLGFQGSLISGSFDQYPRLEGEGEGERQREGAAMVHVSFYRNCKPSLFMFSFRFLLNI